MPSATTLKLPDELKTRINVAANEADLSPHAWMLGALAAQIEHTEQRRRFVEAAEAAEAEVAANGLVHDADAAFGYLRQKLAGQSPRKPKPTHLKNLK